MPETTIFDSPALPLLMELEAQGFAVHLDGAGGIQVQPGSRLTDSQRRALMTHKADVLLILQCCDDSVTERRDAFRRQYEDTPAPCVPLFQFRSKVPYTIAVCFSCGDSNGRRTFGRCWRCSLALRLALRWPISSAFVQMLDEARVA